MGWCWEGYNSTWLISNTQANTILQWDSVQRLWLIDIDLNDIIDDTYVTKFDDHTSKLLQKKILEGEILDVLKNMKNKKVSWMS